MKYLVVSLCVLLTVSAQVLLKQTSAYVVGSKNFILFIVSSMLIYCLAFLAQSQAMRYFPLSKVSPAMSIATMVLIFIAGILFFKETVVLKQIIGIIFGIVAVYLIMS
ncbi:EamA family transporter [Bacteroidales bacterium OttesenSCG-928-C19]|nr:EamA family transporter [Bacteroidales bacterium OttesenSCG-928-C19]